MTASLQRYDRLEAIDASISATEQRIAAQNERIILDLMRGRDTRAEEEKVARDMIVLAGMRKRRDATGRRSHR